MINNRLYVRMFLYAKKCTIKTKPIGNKIDRWHRVLSTQILTGTKIKRSFQRFLADPNVIRKAKVSPMSMYRHVPDGIGRPHTSGESIQCALDEIEGIVREKKRSAVPYLFEDVDRPSTFPGKSRNSQKYAETSMSVRANILRLRRWLQLQLSFALRGTANGRPARGSCYCILSYVSFG